MSSFLEVLNPNKNWTIGNGKKHSNMNSNKVTTWEQYPEYYLKEIDVVDCSIANIASFLFPISNRVSPL